VKVTVTLRCDPSPGDLNRLLARLRIFNEAANWLSAVAFEEKIWGWLSLQRRAYRELRDRFGLRAAEAVVCVRKAAYAYRNKHRRSRRAVFRATGAMPLYNHRYKRDGTVAFYGFRIPFAARPNMLLSSNCEARLVWDGSKFLIRQAVEIQEPAVAAVEDFVGVDLGIARIAVDSDGKGYPQEPHPFREGQLRGLRKRHNRLRGKLQGKGTKSARRLLKERRRKERRFAAHVNHAIAKDLVAKAKGSGFGIALEDLQGIRARIKVRRAQRRDLHSWAFGQLRAFLEYKAQKEGVRIVLVDPKYTSQTCPLCGRVDRRNRPNRGRFECVGCGFAGPADAVAAENIRRAARSRPNAAA